MTLLDIPKQVGDMDEPWWSIVRIDSKRVVWISCPDCHMGMTLHNYKVLDDGTVKAIGGSNSVVCPGCVYRKLKKQFHYTVRLLNWDPELLK